MVERFVLTNIPNMRTSPSQLYYKKIIGSIMSSHPLHRSLLNHWIWLSESFTQGQAWVDMVLLANHASGKMMIKGQLVKIERGQLGRSKLNLAKRWRWSRGKLNRFLSRLEMEHMIVQQAGHLTTVITLCNYDRLHSTAFGGESSDDTTDRASNEATDGHLTVQQSDIWRDTNNNVNNVNNDNNDKNDNKPKSVRRKASLSETEKKRKRVESNSVLMIRIGDWFGRKENTRWSIYEAEALSDIGDIPEYELVSMRNYYEAEISKDSDYRRRNIETLLNNWSGELDRAIEYCRVQNKRGESNNG